MLVLQLHFIAVFLFLNTIIILVNAFLRISLFIWCFPCVKIWHMHLRWTISIVDLRTFIPALSIFMPRSSQLQNFYKIKPNHLIRRTNFQLKPTHQPHFTKVHISVTSLKSTTCSTSILFQSSSRFPQYACKAMKCSAKIWVWFGDLPIRGRSACLDNVGLKHEFWLRKKSNDWPHRTINFHCTCSVVKSGSAALPLLYSGATFTVAPILFEHKR